MAEAKMRLRDSAGISITSDDDSGTGLDSLITYTPTVGGTYYLSGGSFDLTSGIGTYRVSAADVTPAPVDKYAYSTTTSGAFSGVRSRSGNIETAGDTDWFRITLT